MVASAEPVYRGYHGTIGKVEDAGRMAARSQPTPRAAASGPGLA